jgi:hypothetical protein
MEEINEKQIQALNEIFAKAAKDPEFRNSLLKEPSSVLEKYELSGETKQMMLNAVRDIYSH